MLADVEFTQSFACTPSELFGILVAPEFLEEFASEVGVTQRATHVSQPSDSTVVELHWKFPTNNVPAFARRFVPDVVELDWRTSWTDLGGDSMLGTYLARSGDPSAQFTGNMSIRAAEGGRSELRQSGSVHAERRGLIPGSFITGPLESLFHAVLADEAKVVARWLNQSA